MHAWRPARCAAWGGCVGHGRIVLLVQDLTGAFVFALSGALLATRKAFDIVGLIILAELTAIGGGVIRDLISGAVPPAAFASASYIVIAFAAAVLTFFFHGPLHRHGRLVLVSTRRAWHCTAWLAPLLR